MTNEQLVAHIRGHINEAENMLQLYNQNRGFIYKMAMKFQNYAEIEDLLQEGYLGLCEAVKHYKCDEAASFISYAAFWIKQKMQRYIYDCCNNVRVPVYARCEVQQYKKIMADYLKWYGKEPTDREMRAFLDVGQEKLDTIKQNALVVKIRSLDEVVGGEDDNILLGETVPSEQNLEEDVIKKLDAEIMAETLWKAVDDLPGNQGEIIRKRYQDSMTLNALGNSMGVTLERVRQEEAKGMRELRKPKAKNQKFQKYYEQYLTASPIYHVGLRTFNRTWTSSVEAEALGW